MFLNKLLEENRELINQTRLLHVQGLVVPDTYVIDMDQLIDNAKAIKLKADELNIELYFMLKQLGHNPVIAKELMKIGYAGAVCVDFKEAEIMIQNNIPICNIGHLVQIPQYRIRKVMMYGVKYITVYTLEIVEEINRVAKELGIVQPLILRVVDDEDYLYSSQEAGFQYKEINEVISKLKSLSNIRVEGLTSFPMFVFDELNKELIPTNNLNTILKTKLLLEENGFEIKNVNMPSSTCSYSLDLISKLGGNSAEPGHGLTGTTPSHTVIPSVEKQCVVYVSEVSHHFKENSYIYGGGYYRRGHLKNALIINKVGKEFIDEVILPDIDSIDYHFGLKGKYRVGDLVLMAFRFQMFTSRSNIVLVKGIKANNPTIIGTYNAIGGKLNE
ncbi:MAG TPA: alanine racemase [Erysipelotrichaceae bacterium]|nr:alanine racemase [Erysipelotrichaceae bacterium]